MTRRPSLVVTFALALLALTLLVAILGSAISPHLPTQQNLFSRMQPPLFFGGDAEHILGTDRLGRDLLARLADGLRMSLIVAALGTALGAIIGCTLGFIAAHFRGWVEETIMMAVDVQASLPFILIALTLLAFFGNSFGLFIVLMALFGWESYARLSRGVVLSALNQPYAESVTTLGATPWRSNRPC